LSTPLILALLALPMVLVAAHYALRRDRHRTALCLIIVAPLVAATTYVASERIVAPAPSAAPAPTRSASTEPPAAQPVDEAPSATASTPGGGRIAELHAQAEEARRAKNYALAASRFREITQIAPFDPDGWADWGDAQAAAAGGDLTAGQAAIDRALELDANHPKALWLKASLKLQLKDYKAAADLWQRLLRGLPADSSDAKIVQTNLDEAKRLMTGNGAKP